MGHYSDKLLIPLQEIELGVSDVVLTGGSESMSQAPFAVRNVRFGTKLGFNIEVSCSSFQKFMKENKSMNNNN